MRLCVRTHYSQYFSAHCIGTRKEFRIFYGKSIGVLSEIISGNIKKEKLKTKELVKSN